MSVNEHVTRCSGCGDRILEHEAAILSGVSRYHPKCAVGLDAECPRCGCEEEPMGLAEDDETVCCAACRKSISWAMEGEPHWPDLPYAENH